METRKRALPFDAPSKSTLVTIFRNYMVEPVAVSTEVYTREGLHLFDPLDGIQITESESHPEWRARKQGRFTKDIGGPFSMYRKLAECKNPVGSVSGRTILEESPIWPNGKQQFLAKYQGPCLPLPPSQMFFPQFEPSNVDTLNELGAEAIARCSPSNPAVDLSVTIGELFKEGIPSLIGGTLKTWKGLSNSQRRKAIGQEYLNYEFGWKPLVNDLLSFAGAMLDATSSMRNYAANSGKLVRRSYDFPEVKSESTTVLARNVNPWVDQSVAAMYDPTSSGGNVVRTSTVNIRRWFRGAFTYYVPPPRESMANDIAYAIIMARKTFGISLTPDTLWNLAPWSWAVDWFSNTGDILSNWTDWAIDNQVLAYGYLMEHMLYTNTYTFTGNTGFQSGNAPFDVKLTTEVKTRTQATPYGFGVRWDDLSFRQQAIIAALGLSRDWR